MCFQWGNLFGLNFYFNDNVVWGGFCSMRCRYYPKWESKCIPNENQEIFMSSKRESKYDPSTPSHLIYIYNRKVSAPATPAIWISACLCDRTRLGWPGHLTNSDSSQVIDLLGAESGEVDVVLRSLGLDGRSVYHDLILFNTDILIYKYI